MSVDISIPDIDDVAWVAVAGELDVHSSSQFVTDVMRAAGRVAGCTVRVDLAAVTFIDAAGLGGLLECRRRLTREGRRLDVVHPADPVTRVLTLTGLEPVFTEERPAVVR